MEWRDKLLLPDELTRKDLVAMLNTLSKYELKTLDYLVFGYQRRFKRHFSISKERIARHVGCTPRHIPRVIHKLRVYGFIDIFSQPEKKCHQFKASNIFWDFKVRKQLYTILSSLVFFPLWWTADPIQGLPLNVIHEKRSYSYLNLEITPLMRKSLLMSTLPIEKGTKVSDYVKKPNKGAHITTGVVRPFANTQHIKIQSKKFPYKKEYGEENKINFQIADNVIDQFSFLRKILNSKY